MPQFNFDAVFAALTDNAPFPWQQALYRELFAAGRFPTTCNLPTGLGKTSVIPIWLIALAAAPDKVPRRLVYVVNRRTVVDQATREAANLREKLKSPDDPHLVNLRDELKKLCAIESDPPLAISTLRGQFADNREWSRDPARPAVVVGTVDMIGSRLLFSGYGCGFKTRPLHAGFLGWDSLLVHDEAHLEPAFQKLLETIQSEQEREHSAAPRRGLRVMALTATSRGGSGSFTLSDADREHREVRKRIEAKKTIALHPTDEKKVADRIAELALAHKDSGGAVLVFVRSLADVEKVTQKLEKVTKNIERLTGTLRGLERDRLVEKPVFQRFLPASNRNSDAMLSDGTAYLVCTSAGEVGVNISADHLVCDLTPFDSMAQRFGRVNRFGLRDDTRIDVVSERERKEKNQNPDLEDRRWLALELLQELNGNASPAALGDLDPGRREAAFTPTPKTLTATDILFDAWSLTSIGSPLVSEPLPGRPPVAEYLHGIEDDKQPETSIAWRDEVWHLREAGLTDEQVVDLLDIYPLKPHELLRDATYRVAEHLSELAARQGDLPVWVQDPRGSILRTKCENLPKLTLDYRTVILPPLAGGLRLNGEESAGLLDGNAAYVKSCHTLYDVADKMKDADGEPLRWHGLSDAETEPDEAKGMRRLTPPIPLRPTFDDDEWSADDDETVEEKPTHFEFYARPRAIEGEQSRVTRRPVRWDVHTEDVSNNVTRVLKVLDPGGDIQTALALAARFHDLGKRREWWQRSIGNPNPTDWYAKSGGKWKPWPIGDALGYRHEFGSLLDVLDQKREFRAELDSLPVEVRELALHLIASHHGRGRPHFPADEGFDPERPEAAWADANRDVPGRFARLQRRYGRWGLAYIESLLRSADYEASAHPSKEEET